jgi:hypothetical protein
MTIWIGHLRIAEHLLRELDDLLASDFAVGNVAPDSRVPTNATAYALRCRAT